MKIGVNSTQSKWRCMEKTINNLHESAKEVLETMAVSKLAVKSIEDVAKRANRITRWARNNGQMGAEANSIKKMAKELNDVMDKWTKGDTVIVP